MIQKPAPARVLLLMLCLVIIAGAAWFTRDFWSTRHNTPPAITLPPKLLDESAIPELPTALDELPPAKPKADPNLTRRLIKTTSAPDTAKITAILLDPAADDTARNEAANLLRRSGCKTLTADLIRVLDRADEGERFRSFCVQHLFLNVERADQADKDIIAERLRAALADRHIKVRREALLSLANMGDPLGATTAVDWLTSDAGEGARDVAVRCVENLGLKQHIPAVRDLARDSDETTRVTAIGLLGRWKDAESRPIFDEAVKSGNPRIQRAGQAAMKSLEKQ